VPPFIKKVHQEVARRGMCPLLFRGFEGSGSLPHSQEKFWTCDCATDAEKPFSLFQSIEKLEHFEINFLWEKNNAK
jgi:hypothetical protein